MASGCPPLARGAVSALTPTEFRSVQHAVQNFMRSERCLVAEGFDALCLRSG